jgi:hypothetical protein
MPKRFLVSATVWIALTAHPVSEAAAAAYVAQNASAGWSRQVTTIQYVDKHWRPGPHGGPGPRVYPGWRGEPGWRGAPAWRGPPGWAGRPYWFGRPWVRRPYYGTIIAGVALGTILTVAAIGAVPPRPRPDLCWYWADPEGTRGYWDYC